MDKYIEWINNLKVEDKVFLETNYGIYPDVVKKITKTMIITKKVRINKNTGRKCGENSWNITMIRPYSEKIHIQIREKRKLKFLVNKIKISDFSDLLIKDLELILRIIKKENENKKTNSTYNKSFN